MPENPFLEILAELLRSKHAQSGLAIVQGLTAAPWKRGFVLVSYQRDFQGLWDLIQAKRPEVLAEGPVDILLAWDDVPEGAKGRMGAIAVQDWLTAFDWVVAFAHRMTETPGPRVPPIRVLLLDLRQSPSVFSEFIFAEIATLFPWLRVYRPVSTDEAALRDAAAALGPRTARVVAKALDLPQLLRDLGLGEAQRADFPTIDIAPGSLDVVRSIWTNELTKAESRHSISNLIAPLLLAEELKAAGAQGADRLVDQIVGRSAARSAVSCFRLLLNQLRLLGATPTPAQKKFASPLQDDFVAHDMLGQFRSLRFLLVDDNSRLGYEDILKCILNDGPHGHAPAPPTRAVDVASEQTPDCLLDWIADAAPRSASEICLIGRPVQPESTLATFDILLLDLRLFGPDDKDAEFKFLGKLIGVCTTHKLASREDGVLDKAIAAANQRRQQLKDGKTGEVGFEHLILLPALLSVLDPSLPIILFSSTHQRDVVEQLAAFPNIITTFAKPLISGYRETTAPVPHITRLRQAIAGGLRLHESRIVWRRLAEFTPGKAPFVSLELRPRRGASAPTPPADLDGLQFGFLSFAFRDTSGALDMAFGSKQRLVPVLAEYYRRYILASRFGDFGSMPSEFLERLCSPPQIESDINWRRVAVQIPLSAQVGAGCDTPELKNLFNEKGLKEESEGHFRSPRNALAVALHICRNRKVHGYGLTTLGAPSTRKKTAGRIDHGRMAALLQFLVLVDFLEGRALGHSAPLGWHDICRRFRRAHPGVPQRGSLSSRDLTSLLAVDWDDYVLFALLEAHAGAASQLADATNAALVRCAELRWP